MARVILVQPLFRMEVRDANQLCFRAGNHGSIYLTDAQLLHYYHIIENQIPCPGMAVYSSMLGIIFFVPPLVARNHTPRANEGRTGRCSR
jgi:hypothetical protein